MENKLLTNTIHGLKWSSISQILRQILQYITTIVLVGLISPDDFGLMAMSVIVIGFLDIFKDLGTSSAIIQKDNPSKLLKSSIYWVNIAIGISITLIIIIVSPLVALLFNSVKVEPILNVLAFTFTISSFSILQKAILEKQLSFELLSKIELISSTLAFLTAIVLAINGFGVWSLVLQALVNSSVNSALVFIYSQWKPGFLFNFSEVKSVARYSLNLLGFNVINYFARNSDYFLIGKYLGDRELGHYYLAYRLMLYPVQNITIVISRVLFPSFSIIKNDNSKFRKVYTQVTNSIALITFPMMFGLALVSYSLAPAFFHTGWNSNLIAQLILILAPIGALQSVISTVGNIYQAKGRTDWMFRWSLFYSSITVLGFIIGLKWGVIGVATSYLITNIITIYPVFVIPFKLIEMSIVKFFFSFKATVFSVIIMSVVVKIFSIFTQNFSDSLTRLIALVSIGILSYTLISMVINKEKLMSLRNIFKQYINSAK